MTLYQSCLSNYLTSSPSEEGADIESIWNIIQTVIRKAADEALGSKRKIHRKKGLQIWDEEIAEAIKEKKALYHTY